MKLRTFAQLSTSVFQLLHHTRNLHFLSFQTRLDFHQLRFQLNILLVLDDLWRITDDGAEEFFFSDLFEVGEAELRE